MRLPPILATSPCLRGAIDQRATGKVARPDNEIFLPASPLVFIFPLLSLRFPLLFPAAALGRLACQRKELGNTGAVGGVRKRKRVPPC